MIASLPWYDFNETSGLLDQFWTRFREKSEAKWANALPKSLDRKTPHLNALMSKNLVMTQTCGYDIFARTPGPLKIIATPIYQTDGASSGRYSSFLVSRKASKINSLKAGMKFGRFVANDSRSFSGYHCVREQGPVQVKWSGGHLQSIEMINKDLADWAAIDVVTWELVKKHRPKTIRNLEIFGQTRQVLAPPLVTNVSTSAAELEKMRCALGRINEDPVGRQALGQLLITGFCRFTELEYQESIGRI